MTDKQQALIDFVSTAKKTYRYWLYDTIRIAFGNTGPFTLFSTGKGSGVDAFVPPAVKSYATAVGPQDGKFGQGDLFIADRLWQFVVPQVGQMDLNFAGGPAFPSQMTDRDVLVEKFHWLIGISGATTAPGNLASGAWAEFTLGQDQPFLRMPLHLIPTATSQTGVGAYRADDYLDMTYPGAIILENNRQFQVTITLQAGAWNYQSGVAVVSTDSILLYGQVLEGYFIRAMDYDAQAWAAFTRATNAV